MGGEKTRQTKESANAETSAKKICFSPGGGESSTRVSMLEVSDLGDSLRLFDRIRTMGKLDGWRTRSAVAVVRFGHVVNET